MQTLQVKPHCKACLWRQARPKPSHFVLKDEASGAGNQPSAMADHFRKAKKYKDSSVQAQREQPFETAEKARSAFLRSNAQPSDQLASYGDNVTAQQEEELKTALEEVQQSPRPDPAAPGAYVLSAQYVFEYSICLAI